MKKKGLEGLLEKKQGSIHLLRVRHARTIGSRFKGLLGVGPEAHDYALVFHLVETGILPASIHMLFMRMPIDVVWLDEKKCIVDLRPDVQPWTLNASPNVPARYIVELPAGTISTYKLSTRNSMNWK